MGNLNPPTQKLHSTDRVNVSWAMIYVPTGYLYSERHDEKEYVAMGGTGTNGVFVRQHGVGMEVNALPGKLATEFHG
jgi:hypothetical protein